MDTMVTSAIATATLFGGSFLLYVLVQFHRELGRPFWRADDKAHLLTPIAYSPACFQEETHDQKSERWLQSIVREGKELGWTIQE
jgi:hypothetical protein